MQIFAIKKNVHFHVQNKAKIVDSHQYVIKWNNFVGYFRLEFTENDHSQIIFVKTKSLARLFCGKSFRKKNSANFLQI
jgi:hypothetical protein